MNASSNASTSGDRSDPPILQGDLRSFSFLGLLLTQFLGAANDNILRWLVIGIGKQYVDDSSTASILMAGTACFVVPYLLLAAPAGYLADRHSKRTVIVFCKLAEMVIVCLATAAILTGQLWGLLAIVALMGAQSALFSPAKSGSIPEMLAAKHISGANGLFGLATVVATVIGAAVGNLLTDWTHPKGQSHWWLSAAIMFGVASSGCACSLLIAKLPVANRNRHFPWDAPVQTYRDLKLLSSNLPLLRVALGIMFFWTLGTLANLNIDQFAFDGGAIRQGQIVPLLLSLVMGVGIGSVAAGLLSAGRIELGLLPLGAGGVVVSSILLFTVQGTLIDSNAEITASFIWACFLLFILGGSAGFFNVPLEAYMQHRSPRRTRGSILAAGNFLTFLGILCASIGYWGLRNPWFPGELENVSVVARAELSPEERGRIDERIDRFQNRPPTQGLADQDVSGIPLQQRQILKASLMWTDLREKSERNLDVDPSEYATIFPDDPELVDEVFSQFQGRSLCTSRQMFLLSGVFTIPVFFYIVLLVPQAFLRFIVWLLSRTVYRLRVYGVDRIPESGGALLVPNHVSWADGIWLLLTSSRPVRMVVDSGNFRNRTLLRMADQWGAILISSGPKSIVRALQTARQALNNGEIVCIFPEGGITRSGQLQAFRPGLMKVLEGTDVPVIPVYLDELWGSIFSFERRKFFWKIPKRVPYPVSIFFGEPIYPVHDIHQVRQAVQKLGAEAVSHRKDRLISLPKAMIRMCKKRRFKSKVADSMGMDLTGAKLLTRTLVLRRLLLRNVLESDEQYVGTLLPPSVGGLVANMALALDQRVAINLNYTVTSRVLNECISQAKIKHVLTSRKFWSNIQKMQGDDYSLNAELVFLEDFQNKVKMRDKIVGALNAYVVPAAILSRTLRLGDVALDDLATVIFTSGSTGRPKGVMLTYANIASNVEAIDQVIHIESSDTIVGILPFFHSFGYTVTMWTPMALNVKAVYHFNPLEAKQIGKLVQKHSGTILLSTPTFLRSYLRRCSKEDFQSLDVVVAGAEKLPQQLCDAFEEKFGIRPVEGYGTTELSPLVSVNIPPSRSFAKYQKDRKEGSVGRPVPGVSAKVINLDSGDDQKAGETGMLAIRGPNVMKGYLGQPEQTAEVIRDGWYVTGDIAFIDDEGFIHITGRQSRFSKIGGEMVPHIQIEEKLNESLGMNEDDGLLAAVTAVPDTKKGERLIVLHRQVAKTPDQLREELKRAGLPNIFIPSEDSFLQVDELPLLGSGKLDLSRIKQMAMEQFASNG